MTRKQDTAIATSSAPILALGALPPPGSIPAVPEGYKPLDGAAKNALLKVPSEQRAEIDQAMEQLWDMRAEIADDLGKLAPDAEKGKALHAQMLVAREANRRIQALASYAAEQEALANHAVIDHLNQASSDIDHVAQRNPRLGERYGKVLVVAAQRSAAVADGIARARATKESAAKKA